MWQQKDGELVRIADMGDRHLTNSYRMLLKRWHQLMVMAYESFSGFNVMELQQMETRGPAHIWPVFEKLRLEIKRRGLVL